MTPLFIPSHRFKNKEDIILRDFLALERTRLANERTLFSYIRTSLYLILAGIAFLQIQELEQIHWLGYVSLVLSVCILLIGLFRYHYLKKSLKQYYTQERKEQQSTRQQRSYQQGRQGQNRQSTQRENAQKKQNPTRDNAQNKQNASRKTVRINPKAERSEQMLDMVDKPKQSHQPSRRRYTQQNSDQENRSGQDRTEQIRPEQNSPEQS